MHKKTLYLALFFSLIINLSLTYASGKGRVAVKPREIYGLLINPGIGITTHHSFNKDEKNKLVPESSISYWRLYWGALEPEEGKIKFELIDDIIKKARENGQDAAFRFRLMDGGDFADLDDLTRKYPTPKWLMDLGVKGYLYPGMDGKTWVPDLDDPIVQKKTERFLRELGKRYNGHPDIDHIDIGIVGRWGEWHTSERKTGVPMPSWESQKKVVDWHIKYFDKTPLVMLIAPREAMEYAVSNGCGWRADCLGDMGFWKSFSTHMTRYPEMVDKSNANEAWKRAPVCFEICGVLESWHKNGWDIDWILEEALRMHVSVLNTKSRMTPLSYLPIITKFMKKMGYRLVLRELIHPKIVQSGSNMLVDMTWENIGVAPPYRPYTIALELRGKGEKFILTSDVDIRKWLPGTYPLIETYKLPKNITPGTYTVCLGVLDSYYQEPSVKLAIEGRAEDGWYPLSKIEIVDALNY